MRKQTKIAAVVSAAALLALGASMTSFAASKGTCRPADLIEPQLPKFEKECAQWKQQDEDVLSYALFPAVAKDFFEYREAQQTKVDRKVADKESKAYPV